MGSTYENLNQKRSTTSKWWISKVSLIVIFSLLGTFLLYDKLTEAERVQTYISEWEGNDTDVIAFHEFIREFEKSYPTFAEYDRRLAIFKSHYHYINDFNEKDEHTFTLAVNYFADLSDDEFNASFLGNSESILRGSPGSSFRGGNSYEQNHLSLSSFNLQTETATQISESDIFDFPTEVDWSKNSTVVSPIQWQGHCGACWTFSTVGTLEGAYGLSYGKPIKLSEQQILDCTSAYYGTQGCNGGADSAGLGYAKRFGVMALDDYEYVFTDGNCRFESSKVVYKPKEFYAIPANNTLAFMYQLSKQPIGIGIDCNGLNFRFYHSGIYNSNESIYTLNHALLAVGYGQEQDPKNPDVQIPYYLIKNSWGLKWGNKGYMKIYRRTEVNSAGTNGMTQQMNYPLIEP